MRRAAAILVLILAGSAQAQTVTPTQTWTPLPTWTITPTPLPGQIAPGQTGQTWCGAGLPCGQIPWPVLRLPALASPTPIPTIIISATPSPSATPATPSPTWTPGGPTPTATATWTPTATEQPDLSSLDTSAISGVVATWQVQISATQPPILISGTPMDGIVIAGLEDDAREFFGKVQGLAASVNLGKVSPLITWLLFAVGVMLFVTVTTFLLPVIMAIFGLVRKVIQLVLDFLPL